MHFARQGRRQRIEWPMHLLSESHWCNVSSKSIVPHAHNNLIQIVQLYPLRERVNLICRQQNKCPKTWKWQHNIKPLTRINWGECSAKGIRSIVKSIYRISNFQFYFVKLRHYGNHKSSLAAKLILPEQSSHFMWFQLTMLIAVLNWNSSHNNKNEARLGIKLVDFNVHIKFSVPR